MSTHNVQAGFMCHIRGWEGRSSHTHRVLIILQIFYCNRTGRRTNHSTSLLTEWWMTVQTEAMEWPKKTGEVILPKLNLWMNKFVAFLKVFVLVTHFMKNKGENYGQSDILYCLYCISSPKMHLFCISHKTISKYCALFMLLIPDDLNKTSNTKCKNRHCI